jgi:5'/3'-nucleotidase SurE
LVIHPAFGLVDGRPYHRPKGVGHELDVWSVGKFLARRKIMLAEVTRSKVLAAVCLVTCVLSCGLQNAAGAQGLKSGPLKVLLLNDDGVGAAGIRAMQAALEAAGHTVVVAAPNGNASGASASAQLGEVFLIQTADAANDSVKNEFKILRLTENRIALALPVAATPVEVLVLSRAVTPFVPDLVISGINDGANSGLTAFLSGTVAGASVASTSFSPYGGVPAIAVSLEGVVAPFPPPAGFIQNYGEAADFVVDLIEQLQQHANNGELLPKGIFLNVNYPALPKGEIKGIKVTSQGSSVLFNSAAFAEPRAFQGFPLNPANPSLPCVLPPGGGLCVAAAVPVENNETVKGADTSVVVGGYISISPFATDYTARGAVGNVVMWLQNLK